MDYVGLNILAGIYALTLGYVIGRFLQDCHYRKLLRKESDGYNKTMLELRECNTQLQQDLERVEHYASGLEDDVGYWRHEAVMWKHDAGMWEAKAQELYKTKTGRDE